MPDTLTAADRSALMAKVRGTGNRSTEERVQIALLDHGVRGWVKHPRDVHGKPDFYFPSYKLAVFVDGCFWHACPSCGRIPKSRVQFWQNKIDENRRRDNRVRRTLRRDGYHVMRIWEHELRNQTWLKRLSTIIKRIQARNRAAR